MAETPEPKRTNDLTDKLLPSLAASRTVIPPPIRDVSITDTPCPTLAKFMIDTELPSCIASNNESAAPPLVIPNTLRAEPNRLAARRDMLLPSLATSIIVSDPPSRADTPATETDLPILTFARTDRLDEIVVCPTTDRLLPPARTISATDTPLPNRPNLPVDKLLPNEHSPTTLSPLAPPTTP